MLHPAADNDPKPNNSKTRVGGERWGPLPPSYYSHHHTGDCHISAAPLWLWPPLPPARRVWAAASGVQVHPEGVLGHRDNKSTSLDPTTVEVGPGWDQRNGHSPQLCHLAAKRFQGATAHIHPFLPTFFPCLGTAVNKTKPLPPGDLHSSLHVLGDNKQGAGKWFCHQG